MLGVLGVYAASLLLGVSTFLTYNLVSAAKSFAVAKRDEAVNFHLMNVINTVLVSVGLLYALGAFVSYGALISVPLSVGIFAISLKAGGAKGKPLEPDPRADELFHFNCITERYLIKIVPSSSSPRVKKFKELISAGGPSSVLLRYALASPATALLASSLYPAFGPPALFAMGFSLQGKVALFSAIGGWLGLLASLKGEMGPITRAKLIEEKLKMFLKNVTFPEALAIYLIMVAGLSATATYGFYKKVKDWGVEVVALFVPLVAYAIAENRFGEPLAVASFALGATLSALGKGTDPFRILKFLAKYLRRLGAIIVDYDVPLTPYLAYSSFLYHALSVRCEGLKALVEYFKNDLRSLLQKPLEDLLGRADALLGKGLEGADQG